MITVYTLENCPHCEEIKAKLTASGYEYEEMDMSLPENITELRINGCFAMEAPVVCVDGQYYEYCHCQAPGFFSELFGVRQDKKETPDIGGSHYRLGEKP